MAVRIETFSNLKGGNSFFKAATHPHVAAQALALRHRLEAATSVAIYDPMGFAEGFGAVFDLSRVRLTGCYVQAAEAVGTVILEHTALPVTELPDAAADLVFIAAFDAERMAGHIAGLLPIGATVVTLDAMRLPRELVSNQRNYLDPLNFATNFAFFRDRDGHHTRVTTANYWSEYGSPQPQLALTLFGAEGNILAQWQDKLGPAGAGIVLDSQEIRQRFDLEPFEGQLFIHVAGGAGHDVVKYALDTWSDFDSSLSCTHDANAWPADFYAGLPAPREDEEVILWVQNSLTVPIPEGVVSINLMGDKNIVPFPHAVAPFATMALNVTELLPNARWPQQIEIATGRHVVRPRYEVRRGNRLRIAHPNVERTDLKPNPAIAELAPIMGKGFLLPAPVLPPDQWRSIVLPTPMATTQKVLPLAALVFDPDGREIGRHAFGRLQRSDSVALDMAEIADLSNVAWGHVELLYDFAAGIEVDGWLHGLFRYEHKDGHTAETSFGAHIFNTVMTWRDEPQSYAGRPPGLSTRLFLRLGAGINGTDGPLDTLCHLIYPASKPWVGHSSTDLMLSDGEGREVAHRLVEIPCGGSLFWRYHEMFTAEERRRAGTGAYVMIRDKTCRLFGYHGLSDGGQRFSLDHMFGY
ncbi:MAG TPA: hypothetical protein VL574_02395 [Stellaceae bacterium]|nr:hypothetical protein [Stellaceae bacterium]